MSIGPGEVLIVLVVALVVLGPEKLPVLMRNVAKIYRELRQFVSAASKEVETLLDSEAGDLDTPSKLPQSDSSIKDSGGSGSQHIDSQNGVNPDLTGFRLVDGRGSSNSSSSDISAGK